MIEATIERRKLLTADLGKRNATCADLREIHFKPGQETGRHLHPAPVVGYVVKGTAIFQVEGQPEQTVPSGPGFYEPANTVIARFDYASNSDPMTFITCYLLDGEQELIQMLE